MVTSGYLRWTFLTRLFAPVDIASLAYFRIVFGAIMLWEVWRYFSHDWISRYWIDPSFYFTYYGFDWVKPWAGDGMYLHFYALGVLAICIMIGFQYRISTTLFFLGFTYVFLLDESRYLNQRPGGCRPPFWPGESEPRVAATMPEC